MSDPPETATLQSQLDALRSEATRQQLEADQLVHDFTAKVTGLEADLAAAKGSLEQAQRAALEEKGKRELAETKVTEAEGRVQLGGDKDEELQKKVDKVEREKRDLLEVVEKEKRDREGVEETLTALRQTHTTLLTAHAELEASLASTTSTSRTSLLRIQTLESTVTSLQADKTFLSTELERGRSEWSNHRSEKHAELVRLQSQLDSRSVEAQSAQSSLTTLKKAHESLKGRHEETLAELASLKEKGATNEQAFASEMGSMRRLVELMEKREEERKQRIEEIEKALEEERAGLAEREEELRDQLLGEKERADALEARNAELREALERGAPPSTGGGMPDSPGSANGSLFALSPSAQRAAAAQRPGQGRSYAEVYREYIRMEEELARERAETKRLGECLAQILGDIEERAPLLTEQRLEYERLSVEATSLASQLAAALSDCDSSARTAESLRLDLTRVHDENTILSQHLSDLGRQVRTLTRVLGAQENPSLGDANDPQFDEEEAAIQRRAEEIGDTDAVVSAHLVTFRNLNELQAQNQKLLKITREMGARLEKGEEDARTRVRGEENEAIREAHELVLRLKEEVEAQRERVAVGEKEREMLRRIVQQRGGAFGASAATALGGATTADVADSNAARLLADVQAAFEAYKTETGVDMGRLREDLQQAQRDAGTIRTELAKEKARGEFTAERFRLLTESYDLQQSELGQASKRALELQGTIAKLDVQGHKMTEDLLSLRTSTSTLQHENTTLRSEREVLKSVEKRLVDENAALSAERARMAELMRGLQGMQNELERSGGEQRRRLEESVKRLEGQTTELKDKLNQAEDSNRQLSLRKEIEGKTFQERIDKLTAEHSITREQLIVAKTSQEHLEQRVRDLVLQVEAKEEKLAVFEGRSGTGEGDTTRSVEEQLQVTVADLRNELRTVRSELERAKEHVAQYQAIAESQGESLREVTATYEEYKSSTDASIAEKDSEISSLRERLHSLTTDLTASNTQNSDLHRQIETERSAFEKERKTFEDGLISLRSADAAAREAQLAAQEDMRRQAQIAKDAHEKYERELVAHAEDVKRLSEVKEEMEKVRATVREHQSAAEVARANLVKSEESWERQKVVLEAELGDIRKRSDEVKEQNSTLAQHLETASAQATQLQARHAAVADAAGGVANGGADADTFEAITASHNSSVEQLREVIRYLRREKDIIDLQLDFSKQEATRLRQQLEFTSRGLEEARQSLQEERQKVGDSLANSAQHTELLESIHTAKLLRESNQTLRDENEANLRKVTTLDSQVRTLQGELAPLKEQLRTLEAEVESKQHNIKLLEEDNERWKTRNQTILAKYERIDPEELQVLKSEVEKVQAQLAAVEQEKAEIMPKLEEQTKLAESMRSNWQTGLDRFKALQAQARGTRDERNAFAKTIDELKEQLASASAGGSEAVAAAASEAQAQAQEAITKLEARLAEVEKEKSELDTRLAEQQTRLTEQQIQQTTHAAALEELKDKMTALDSEKTEIAAHRDRLAAREGPIFRDNKRMTQEAKASRASLAAIQSELDALKATIASGDHAAAIEAAVQSRLAEAAPAPAQPTDEQISEAAKKKVAAAEAQFVTQRDEAIAAAVKTATEQLEKDLATVRTELETAKAASVLPTADGVVPSSTGTGDQEVKKAVEAAVETARRELEANFEKIKESMAAESSKREKEVSERLTTALRKAQQQASAAASAAPSSAPLPNVEALVQEKVAELDKERTKAQQQAVEKAVGEALEKQAQAHYKLLQETKEQIETQAALKNSLLHKTVQGLRKKLADQAGAPSATKPAAVTTAIPAAPASTPIVPPPGLPAKPGTAKPANTNGATPASTTSVQPSTLTGPGNLTPTAGHGGAAAGRGRGGARGRGGNRGGAAGGVGRGGKAAASPPAASAASASAGTPAQAAGAPALNLRGNAIRGGGVLGTILGAAGLAPGQQGGKRARESDGEASGGAGGQADQAKRPKGA